MTLDAVVAAIGDAIGKRGGRQQGKEIRFLCPAHDDHRPSARWNAEKQVWCCDACRASGGWKDLASRLGIDVPRMRRRSNKRRTRGNRPESDARVHAAGCTLQRYAEAKRLPIQFLRDLGLRDSPYQSTPAVRIPYLDETGIERAIRYRVRLEKSPDGDDRFRWKWGTKVLPYGLSRLAKAREAGRVILVEGESDAQTLRFHGYPAIGLPGANTWKEDWAHYFDGVAEILIVIEPDTGGEAVKKWLASSSIRDRVKFLSMPEVDGKKIKDPSDLHLADPERFKQRFDAAVRAATSWNDFEKDAQRAAEKEAWTACEALARNDDILGLFGDCLEQEGYCGDLGPAKLTYLVVTSRLLDRPVSMAVKGPSSAGKSFVVERVLTFFPKDAYYELTAMSDRALAYGEEPLSHRILVIYEAAGMSGEVASYLLRTLLSEGRIKYEFVEKTADGMKPRVIEREGPTGLIVTTTAIRLHPENETRLLSVTLTDSPDQTAAVLRSLADEDHHRPADRGPWTSLQSWLVTQDNRVTIPFGPILANMIPPVSVRLRRDFRSILGLVKAHAQLHQATRERDATGHIVATFEDYRVVRDLAADLIAEGVESSVPGTVRDTVAAVRAILSDSESEFPPWEQVDHVTVTAVARRLRIDRSAASRRVKAAIARGYLRNLARNARADARLVLGDPVPDEVEVLPTVEALAEACMRARESEGIPNSPDDDWDEIRIEP